MYFNLTYLIINSNSNRFNLDLIIIKDLLIDEWDRNNNKCVEEDERQVEEILNGIDSATQIAVDIVDVIVVVESSGRVVQN